MPVFFSMENISIDKIPVVALNFLSGPRLSEDNELGALLPI
jgi:hypothetical protein